MIPVTDPRFQERLFINSPDFFDDKWLAKCKTSLLKMMEDKVTNTNTSIVPQNSSHNMAASSLLKNARKLLGPPSVSMSGKETPQQELAHYMANSDLPLDGCVLSWWKANQALYPRLAKVARNVLAIPGMFLITSLLVMLIGIL